VSLLLLLSPTVLVLTLCLLSREAEVRGVSLFLKGKHQGDNLEAKPLMTALNINKGNLGAEATFIRGIPKENCTVLVIAPVSFTESAPAVQEAVSHSRVAILRP
jgi:hypothetical protein